jgi:Ca2+/H+ antiporter, TMEM165/GDT1 family
VLENTMKFAVGLMLATFGIFWSVEGTGVSWPGADVALLGIFAFLTLVSLGLVAVLRRMSARQTLMATNAASMGE